jgi:hypothetical protein
MSHDQQKESAAEARSVVPSILLPLELMDHAMIQANVMSKNDQQLHQRHHEWRVQELGPAPGRCDRILVLPLDPLQRTGIMTYM